MEQKAILSPANIDEWDSNMTKVNFTIQEQEADIFFSQKVIAPSPMVTPTTRNPNMYQTPSTRNYTMYQTPSTRNVTMHQEEDEGEEEDDENDDITTDDYQDDEEDNLLFSPQPLKSSQESMKVLSPQNFCIPVVDALQSTPKTTGSLRRPRHSNHSDDAL